MTFIFLSVSWCYWLVQLACPKVNLRVHCSLMVRNGKKNKSYRSPFSWICQKKALSVCCVVYSSMVKGLKWNPLSDRMASLVHSLTIGL